MVFINKKQSDLMDGQWGECIRVKYRNEWKYSEREAELLTIGERLAGILNYDKYAGIDGKYKVQSLYFDDHKDICARDNVSGEGKRFKYRIRYYGEKSECLYLEKKEKKNSGCHKQKCRLSVWEYQSIIKGETMEVFWKTQEQLLKEFCIDIITKRFSPRAIISYQRKAFVEPVANIRITLDSNICVSDEIDLFLEGSYFKIPVMEKRQHVLEVKFDEVLPSYIKAVLQAGVRQQQSFSKYYLGRIALQQKKVSMI